MEKFEIGQKVQWQPNEVATMEGVVREDRGDSTVEVKVHNKNGIRYVTTINVIRILLKKI